MSRTVSRVLRKKKVSNMPTATQKRMNPSTFFIGDPSNVPELL